MAASRVMVLGVGAFAHAMMKILQEAGAEVGCYLTRDYGHHGPQSSGQTWLSTQYPSPVDLFDEFKPDIIIPMAIAWKDEPWAVELIESKVPILCPINEAMKIESRRQYAEQLCRQYQVAFPCSYTLSNRVEALQLMERDPRPYVLKNPFCSPYSPIHTIVCESVSDTLGWLDRIDYAEGVFLQEYLGVAEAGHFVFVSDGEIHSLVTNQEYKRAFTGNMGPVAGAPLGGIVEQDPEDRYGLAKDLIHPLLPWLKQTRFHGPLQVTAIQKDGQWHAIEYNVRLGVTTGAILLRMLNNPLESVLAVANDRPLALQWSDQRRFGVSLTLAGYGYPYVVPTVPQLPVTYTDEPTCDIWWNEVEHSNGKLYTAHHKVPIMSHRIADCVAFSNDLASALQTVYKNIKNINCLGSYYRTDIGESLWPPGEGY